MSAPISLVVCVYNRESYLSETIASILAQSYREFELVIWDYGSMDRSIAIAQHYAQTDDRVRVVTASHQGIAPSLKAAIAATSGQYLGWVDSDDLLAPTALAQTLAVLDRQPQVGIVYTQYEVIDEQGHNYGLGQRCQTPYSPLQLLVEFMTFHFRLMRRSMYEQVGGIDASYERAEDYDLCLRLSEVTQIHHLAQPMYAYRRHRHNVTNDELRQIRWAYHASHQALQRRGLDGDYDLELTITEHASHLVSQHVLKRKSKNIISSG